MKGNRGKRKERRGKGETIKQEKGRGSRRREEGKERKRGE